MRATSKVAESGDRGVRKRWIAAISKPKKSAKKHLLQQIGCVEYASPVMTERRAELFKNSIKQYVWVLAGRWIEHSGFGQKKIYRK